MGSTSQREYWESYSRAEYFGWAACKGFDDSGNDPILGKKSFSLRHLYRKAWRAAHVAQAKVWLQHAIALRSLCIPLP